VDLTFRRSEELYARAKSSLSGGVSTAFRLSEKPVPLFIAEARGTRLVDVDGNELLDYTCGFGPVILGHAHPAVSDAVARAAAGVQQVAAQQLGEIELAERLCRLVPAFERVRIGLSGSESVHAALRVARAATGRSLVVKFAGHYHGWFDTIYSGTARPAPGGPETAGQPESALADLVVIDWNDPAALEEVFRRSGDRIAAVIMEPIECNAGVILPRPGYLELARKLTHDHGALLVFDEVITGFRVGLHGAQGLLGVVPDLAVVAKAVGNGFPISAFGGRRDVMDLVADNRAIHAGTYNGGGISVAAGLATTAELERDETAYERMNELGRRLVEGLVALGARHEKRLVAQGPGPVFFAWFLEEGGVESFGDHRRADFVRYANFAEQMLRQGVRVIPTGRWYLTTAHTDADVDLTLAAADEALARLP